MTATIVKELDDYGARKGGSACLVEFKNVEQVEKAVTYLANHPDADWDSIFDAAVHA